MQNGVNAEGLDTGDILNRIDRHRREISTPTVCQRLNHDQTCTLLNAKESGRVRTPLHETSSKLLQRLLVLFIVDRVAISSNPRLLRLQECFKLLLSF